MTDARDPGLPAWVASAQSEYEAHRAEVVAEGAASQQILALGATAVGLVVAGAFNVWDNHGLAAIAFLAVIPVLCALVLVQLAGRVASLMRVGVYLQALETKIGEATGAPSPC